MSELARVPRDLGTAAGRIYRESGARSRVTAGSWILLYLLLALLPLAVIAISPPPGRDFLTELSVTLGFIGLAMLGLQFAITARFRRVQAPYGMDVILLFHRQIALVAFAFILVHPVLLVVANPDRLSTINPIDGPLSAVLGWSALVALTLLVVFSLWRVRFGLSYEWWRISHGVLAVLGLGLALWHVIEVGWYLGQPWKQGLWLAMGVAVLSLLAYTRIVRPWMLIRRPWVVEEVRAERGDSWTLALRADGHAGMRFRPGQFAWLTVGRSPFAIKEHPFSFSSSALQQERVELTIKELGDFTSTVGEIEPGTRAFLDGPYGVFTSDRYHGAGYAFYAGGIGVTPVMSMLRTLAERGDTRPVLLINANSDLESVTFLEEIEEHARREHVTVVHVLEDPPDEWDGETGYVDAELLERHLPEHAELYEHFICGPPPMMNAVEEGLLAHGIALGQIHTERFNII